MRPWRRIFPTLSLLVAFAGEAPALRALGSDYVVVSATAAPEYKRRKGPDGIMAESYVFSPGLHFGGTTRDKSQEKMPFTAVAQTLAASLARQQYFPAKDPTLANLVIIVHWGSTETYEDPNRQSDLERLNTELTAYQAAIQESGMASGGAVNGLLSNQEGAASRQEQYLNANAELLGFKRSLVKEGANIVASEEEKTMRLELSEERYFVVLMAYDYQLLKKEKKPRLLWVTRMSMRSPGNNFVGAVPGMAHVAGNFFGQQHDDISRVKTDLREGKVEIGELKVIGAVPEITPPGKKP